MIRFFSAFIAGLYIFSIVLTDFIHPLLHQQHDLAIHSAANEQDPCHRAIYHGERETKEGHHNHLSPTPDKCWLCDIIYHHEYTPASPYLVAEKLKVSPVKTDVTVFASYGFHHLSPSRAPPGQA